MFSTYAKLPGWSKLLLSLLPFFLVVGFYLWGAYDLRSAGPDPTQTAPSAKLMPLPIEMWEGLKSTVLPDRNGDVRLWEDTKASTMRFGVGMLIVFLGIFIGLYMGTFPFWEALLYKFFVVVDKVPPLCLLPILFIVFDIGEMNKIALIVIGVLPGVVLDAYQRSREIPPEQFHKAQTLGASETEIAWSVVLPQIWPKMIGTMRLNFKAALGYVIAGESVAAAAGLGYRVFLVKKYVAMEIIIPYVLWATLIMIILHFTFDWLEKRYVWVDK